MHVKKIELKDFRNYETVCVEFHPNVNLFLGNNAQGKTNLLESIYLTSFGKSFRTNKDREFIRFRQSFCKIELEAVKDQEKLTIEMVFTEDGKKGIKIDGRKINKLSQLLEHVFVVIFSPEDMKIVKDEPEKRRKFIDRELCQLKPSYYNHLNQYKKILAQRNAYLKEEKIDETILDIWDVELAEYGGKVMKQREAFIEQIHTISRQIHSEITEKKENLSVSYESNIPVMADLQEQIFFFYDELKKNRDADRKKRTTGRGPHKDDLKLETNGIDIRSFGSQGQQRTAALSLKLSEIELLKEETGENPILLLDDVLSELDHKRQNHLIHCLKEVQVFITTTELSDEVRNALPRGKNFYIENGTVSSERSNEK